MQSAMIDPSRISVRPFNLSDADEFLKWASDERVTQYLRWNPMTSKEEALAYLENVAIPHPWRRSICLDGKSIGYVSAKPESGDDRFRAYLSYAVGGDHWGQGIVTQALRMAIPMIFQQFPQLIRLQALVDVDNLGSQRVMQKLGFVKEGLLRKYGICKGQIRDFLIYSLLVTDSITVCDCE